MACKTSLKWNYTLNVSIYTSQETLKNIYSWNKATDEERVCLFYYFMTLYQQQRLHSTEVCYVKQLPKAQKFYKITLKLWIVSGKSINLNQPVFWN